MLRPSPLSPLFPYTTLFRSVRFSAFRQERARVGNLGPGVIGSIGDRDDLAVILLSLGGFTRLFGGLRRAHRSEEHTSELHRCISYAVFCLKKKKVVAIQSIQ